MATVAFVTGVPRSGTSALASLLTAHPDIAITHERFGMAVTLPDFGPDYLTAERARTFVEGDCLPEAFSLDTTQAALAKWETASVIGDKLPAVAHVVSVAQRFGPAKVIAIVRDPFSIAQSYQARADNPEDPFWPGDMGYVAAVKDHNVAMTALEAARETLGERLLVVCYERVFSPGADLSPIFRFLGVSPEAGAKAAAQVLSERSDRHRSQGQIADYVSAEADFDTYRTVMKACALSPGGAANTPNPPQHTAASWGNRKLARPLLRYLRRSLHEQRH